MTKVILAALLLAPASQAAALSNGAFTAQVTSRGLASIQDVRFTTDSFSVVIDGKPFRSEDLASPKVEQDRGRTIHRYTAADYTIAVAYELRPGWNFISKQISVTAPAGRTFRVNSVEVFRAALVNPVQDVYVRTSSYPKLQTKDYGGFLRFGNSRGLLALVQNPFQEFKRQGDSFSIAYSPDMEWNSAWGPFESDRGLLAPYRLSGRLLPEAMIPEWKLANAPAQPGMDEAEVEAFTNCVRAFILDKSPRPLNLFVGWCVNDYQIDIARPEGRAEYKRIMDRAGELGANHVLFAPSNSDISMRAESVDDWSWENLLWLGLGQKIRRGEWDVRSSPIPSSVQEMLDYARSKNLRLVAYVYPVLPFLKDSHPEWMAPPKNNRANLGVRSYQDWLIDALVNFAKRTGISGYSFDHTFLNFEGASRYAQWSGWRRVMEELRRQMPEIVMDGRQAYQMYGPWCWLAGSYPHPTSTDEQPESFIPFPDLHFDRVSADRQRYTAWRFRNFEFAPAELMPGYITHQTPRNDDKGDLPQQKVRDPRTGKVEDVLLPFRARDWDYLGWRYSLLSSIATAGLNNVLNMIPARDLDEYRNFSEPDKQWFRKWIDWTAQNKDYLLRTRTIIGHPAIGKVDGTSAIVGNKGFVFLFNPNARRLNAEFQLDDSIGLGNAPKYRLKQVYPRDGMLVGKPGAGFWNRGDRVSLEMDGASAMVLQVEPAPQRLGEPVLFNAPGQAKLAAGVLDIAGVKGEPGVAQALTVLLPQSAAVKSVRVNGGDVRFTREGPAAVSLKVDSPGAPFRTMQQVGSYDPNFTGGAFSGTVTIPARIFAQLAERKKAWPIRWMEEDFRTTWLVPERLLLFVQIAEPDDKMDVSLKIDGQPFELRKAYSSVRTHRASFVGFYADASNLSPDVPHRFDLALPPLKPGQFQGLFFDNVEPESF